MRMGIKKDFGRVEIMLRNIATKVPDGARGQMRRASGRIVERAKLYVPEDTQDLKESIRIEKSYDGRGRLKIDIVVGGKTVIKANGREVDLDQYALIIHERYSEMNPGERTLDKMELNPGVPIGERFMTNAAEDEQEGLLRNMAAAITKIIKAES